MTLYRTMYGRYLPYIWMLFCAWMCREAAGLQCYKCHYENHVDTCLQTQETCGYQQICMNVVYRRPLLGIVYTKGCTDRSSCYALQGVNEEWFCESAPSECLYCCDSDLCNDANPFVTSYSTIVFVMSSISALTYVVL